MKRLHEFTYENVTYVLTFVEHQQVKDGVECDIYTFNGDTTKDLAIVRVEKNNNTPLQRVLEGTHTIEGYMSGTAKLVILAPNDDRAEHEFRNYGDQVEVLLGERMQWQTGADSELYFYEVCTPPFVEGRFENITNDRV